MLSKNPEVSVIICNHVVGELFWNTIASVKVSKNISFEIIILTSSEDLATTGVEGCTVIHSTDMPAKKRNIGTRIAKAPVLAFFDDDVDIDAKCLYYLHLELYKERSGMTYGKLWNMERRDRFDEAGGYLTSTGFIWSRAGQNDLDKGQYDNVEMILAGKSASCAIWKKLFLEIGGFDEDFGILGEETDLSWRVWLAGYRVYYVPKATGYHAFNTKFKPKEKHYTNSRVFYNGCRNYITMLIKNLETRNLWQILPVHVLIWFSAGLVMIGTGKIRQGGSILKGIGYSLFMSGWLLKKRSKVQSGRKVDDRTLWPYIFRRAPRGYYRTRILRYVTLGLHG